MNLEPCLEAVAAGDGREVMQFDEARRLIIFCAGVFQCSLALGARMGRSLAWRTAPAWCSWMVTRRPHGAMISCVVVEMCYCSSGGGTVATDACSTSSESGDGRAIFSITPNGQLKMPRLGNYCLTVMGEGAASAHIAQAADLAATSTNAQHIVKNIADGDAQSYWASASDPAAPVDVQLDFGEAKQIKSVEIDWEHPAQVITWSRLAGSWPALRQALGVAAPRRMNYKWPMGAGGKVCTALLETIYKEPSMWAQPCPPPPCGSV